MAAGTCENTQGYLPGSLAEKSMMYSQPLYQAAMRIGLNPYTTICDDSMAQKKNGTAYIFPMTETFFRGINLGDGDDALPSIILIDEAQNFTESTLRKTLTRVNSGSKAVVMGHRGQIDLPNKSLSGFERCYDHFLNKNDGKAVLVELDINHRGYISTVADEPWE